MHKAYAFRSLCVESSSTALRCYKTRTANRQPGGHLLPPTENGNLLLDDCSLASPELIPRDVAGAAREDENKAYKLLFLRSGSEGSLMSWLRSMTGRPALKDDTIDEHNACSPPRPHGSATAVAVGASGREAKLKRGRAALTQAKMGPPVPSRRRPLRISLCGVTGV